MPRSLVVPTLVMAVVLAAPARAQQVPTLVRDSSRLAAPQPRIESFHIASALLGQTRKIDVALPASLAQTAATRRYPVAIVLDGESNLVATALTAQRLADAGQIPELVLVGIENLGSDAQRVHDLTPPGLSVSGSDRAQGGDRFLDFVERELLPAVDARFRGAGPRVLIGHSSGGILATYAAATRPAFRAVISIDAPIQLDDAWLAKRLIARAHDAATPPLRYASYEARFPWPTGSWTQLTDAAPASWMLRRDSLRLESHETIYALGAYLGLREVFRDYSTIAASRRSAAQMAPYYAAIDSALGASVVPPRRLLANLVEDLIAEGRGAAARSAYATLTNGYGAQPDATATLGEIAEAEKLPPPTETVESLLNAPSPSVREIQPYLGEWRGSIWMTADQPRNENMLFRVRVEGDRVVAETRNTQAPTPAWTRVDYLKVTAHGLTWGRLNGMRPRGVMLWEGTLAGDTLSGTGRWGGISFRSPPEVDPHFSFVRRSGAPGGA